MLIFIAVFNFGCSAGPTENAVNDNPAGPEGPPAADSLNDGKNGSEGEVNRRDFDSTTRFAAEEATFNGISVRTTQEELIAHLGEPLEIIEKPLDSALNTSTYVYEGVEYIFEGESNTVSYIIVTDAQLEYGPRNIRIGESLEDVLSRFPQEQDYRTHPNNCFYGETTYLEKGGAVYPDENGSVIIVVPQEVLPFMKIHFQDGVVSRYIIYGTTT
jgi:hypothetical protein